MFLVAIFERKLVQCARKSTVFREFCFEKRVKVRIFTFKKSVMNR